MLPSWCLKCSSVSSNPKSTLIAAIAYIAAAKIFGGAYGYAFKTPLPFSELSNPPTRGPSNIPAFAKRGRSRRARVRYLIALSARALFSRGGERTVFLG